MVQPHEIEDPKSLEQGLRSAVPFDLAEDDKRRIALTIGHRAVLRSLPVYWKAALENRAEMGGNDSGLHHLSLIFISWIMARRSSGDEVSSKLAKSLSQAFGKGELLTGISDELKAVEAVISIAANTARFSVGTERKDFEQLAYEVSRQVRTANEMAPSGGRPVETAPIAWQNTNADFELLSESADRADILPLWTNENPLLNEWQAVRRALPEGWAFWRDWYQDMLDGNQPNWELLTEIALIESEEWDKGPRHVNRLIEQIFERYRLRKEVEERRAELARLRAQNGAPAWRGDNNPPELIEVTTESEAKRAVEIIWANLGDAEKELETPAPDPAVLTLAGRWIAAAAKALGKYVASLGDVFLKSAAKTAGAAVIPYAINHTPQLVSLGERLMAFAQRLVF